MINVVFVARENDGWNEEEDETDGFIDRDTRTKSTKLSEETSYAIQIDSYYEEESNRGTVIYTTDFEYNIQLLYLSINY